MIKFKINDLEIENNEIEHSYPAKKRLWVDEDN